LSLVTQLVQFSLLIALILDKSNFHILTSSLFLRMGLFFLANEAMHSSYALHQAKVKTVVLNLFYFINQFLPKCFPVNYMFKFEILLVLNTIYNHQNVFETSCTE